MPGPKMGPRPPDFDETVVKQSPTYQRWEKLALGERLRYACREFIKGHGNDEERLLRRIMIARRNNLRDHELLKQARKRNHAALQVQMQEGDGQVPSGDGELSAEATQQNPVTAPLAVSSDGNLTDDGTASQHSSAAASLTPSTNNAAADQFHDATGHAGASISHDFHDMDLPAVEATRSYKAWMQLADGQEFCYNQKYIKGKEGHDWLLKKNIWRRMRYRRENKRMVEQLRQNRGDGVVIPAKLPTTVGVRGHGNAERQTSKRMRTTRSQTTTYDQSQQNTQDDEFSMSMLRDDRGGHVPRENRDDSLPSPSDFAVSSTSTSLLLTGDAMHDATDASLNTHVVNSQAAAAAAQLAASVGIGMDSHAAAMILEQADAACLTDPEAIAAAVAAGESFGKSQKQQQQQHGRHDDGDSMAGSEVDDDDNEATRENVTHHHHLVHNPLALEDAAATAAKLAEAGQQLYGAVDVAMKEAAV